MDSSAATSIGATALATAVRRLRAAGCVFAEVEADLLAAGADDEEGLSAMVARRAGGLPLEQVLGYADFCGVRVRVRPGVFVPRSRTALLVRLATAHTGTGATVLDLCCGSGALGAALAARVPGIELHAADLDAAAVDCARDNLRHLGARVYRGDLFDPLPATLRGRVDVLLANVPYVPTGQIGLLPPEARLHEPLAALDGGADGLEQLRRVARAAPAWLAPGGRVFLETTVAQSATACAVLDAAALAAGSVTDDDLDATVVIGTRTAAAAG